MPTDRAHGRTVKSRNAGTARRPRAGGLRLGAGVQLEKTAQRGATPVLLSPGGSVQLNQGAAAILRLCDGSRGRDAVIAEVVRRSRGKMRVSDVGEFIDAAVARGWIIEGA